MEPIRLPRWAVAVTVAVLLLFAGVCAYFWTGRVCGIDNTNTCTEEGVR